MHERRYSDRETGRPPRACAPLSHQLRSGAGAISLAILLACGGTEDDDSGMLCEGSPPGLGLELVLSVTDEGGALRWGDVPLDELELEADGARFPVLDTGSLTEGDLVVTYSSTSSELTIAISRELLGPDHAALLREQVSVLEIEPVYPVLCGDCWTAEWSRLGLDSPAGGTGFGFEVLAPQQSQVDCPEAQSPGWEAWAAPG